MSVSLENESFDQLVEALMSGNRMAGYEAVHKLAKFDPERSIPVFIHALRHRNDEVRSNGAQGLSLVGDNAVIPLIEVMKDKNAIPSSRYTATGVLGGLGGAAVLPTIELLKDEDPLVREMATFPLGRLGDLRALEPLIPILKNDPVAPVREWAANALGSLRDSRAFEPLVTALHDENRNVRYRVVGALWALARCGLRFERAIEPLMEIADRDHMRDIDISTTAILALGNFGDNRAFELLIRLLDNEANDSRVRGSAIAALGELKNLNAVERLIKLLNDNRLRDSCASALGKIGDQRAIEPLIQCLSDPNPDIRWTVVWALGFIGSEKAVSVLQRVVQTDAGEDSDGDKIKDVASRAIEYIRKQSTNS